MTSPRKALFFSLIDRYAELFVSVATVMVLARLLTPEEVGVFSVTMVFLGIASTIRDLGASEYIVTEKNLSEAGVRSARTVQFGVGLSLGMLVLLLARPAAKFYNAPDMEKILWVLAINFFVIPFGSIIFALWERELKFHLIALSRVFGAILGGGIGISMAYYGYGPISLAWSAVVAQVTTVLLAIFLWKSEFSPLPGFAELRRVFSFGSRLTIYAIIRTIGARSPEMILGRVQGMLQTGFYSRGQGLVSMFDRLVMDAVGNVVLPVFSKVKREGGDLGQSYVMAFGMLTALGWSFLAVLAITAFPAMRIFYGDQWDDAVAITQILCLVMALRLPVKLAGNLLIVNGALSLTVKLMFFDTLITIAFCLVGASYGINGLGWSLALCGLITLITWLIATYRELHYSVKKIAAVTMKSIVIAIASSLPFLIVSLVFGFKGSITDLTYLIPSGIASLALFIILSRKTAHPISMEIDIAVKASKVFLSRFKVG